MSSGNGSIRGNGPGAFVWEVDFGSLRVPTLLIPSIADIVTGLGI